MGLEVKLSSLIFELEKKNNQLSQYQKLHKSTRILYEILVNQRSPLIKTILGFEGESCLVKEKEKMVGNHVVDNHKTTTIEVNPGHKSTTCRYDRNKTTKEANSSLRTKKLWRRKSRLQRSFSSKDSKKRYILLRRDNYSRGEHLCLVPPRYGFKRSQM